MSQPDRDSDPIPIVLADERSPLSACPYLPAETSSLHYRVIASLDRDSYDNYLAHGWRRHGAQFFRPACPACRACRSLRVPVNMFLPSKSQRRCWRKNQHLNVQLVRPTVSRDHIALFNAYHQDMALRRGWPDRAISADEYRDSFLIGHFPFAYELQYFDAQQMIAVGLIDITRHAASSVYFFHDPQYRAAGLGVFSMLVELSMALEQQLDYHYLGYWISDCRSMAYKSQYRPHELLERYTELDEPVRWQAPDRCEAS